MLHKHRRLANYHRERPNGHIKIHQKKNPPQVARLLSLSKRAIQQTKKKEKLLQMQFAIFSPTSVAFMQ